MPSGALRRLKYPDIDLQLCPGIAVIAALIRAHERGVAVRVLIDKTQAGNQYADDEKLEAAGIAVRRLSMGGAFHNKFLIGDSCAVKTGSFNWTKNADERNAENFVILRLKYVVDAFQKEFESYWT